MRTYDKLIATIFSRQGTANLRPLPGVPLVATHNGYAWHELRHLIRLHHHNASNMPAL